MFSRRPRRVLRRIAALGFAALVLVSSGCADNSEWVDPKPSDGWAAQYRDESNSSYTPIAGAQSLQLEWSRSVKGSLFAAPALASGSYLAVNGQTAAGCSLMVWENDNNGRQRWCTRMVLGGGFASPLFDGFDNLYIGQPGTMISYPPTQWVRWRTPVIGMPTTPRFLGRGQLLIATHLGQVQVLDAHRGTTQGSPIDLVAGVDPTDSERGLTDCQPARAGCPVAAAPAYSPSTGQIVIAVWQPGAPAPVLAALRYRPGQSPLLTKEWTSNAVTTGVLGSPVFSADGETLYVNSRDGRVWALRATDGTPKWSAPVGFDPQTPPSVSPDGLIVVGGGADAKLVALHDDGDRVDEKWRRDDVRLLSTVSQAGSDVGYAVVRAGEQGMALAVFGLGDGRTINSYPLPLATGAPTAVSVGHDRRVVTATSDGQVYSLAPE